MAKTAIQYGMLPLRHTDAALMIHSYASADAADADVLPCRVFAAVAPCCYRHMMRLAERDAVSCFQPPFSCFG